jgi:hypothetical protein
MPQFSDDTFGDLIGNSPLRAIALPPRNNAHLAPTKSTNILRDPNGIRWRILPDTTLYPSGVPLPGALNPITTLTLGAISIPDRKSYEAHFAEVNKVNLFLFSRSKKKNFFFLNSLFSYVVFCRLSLLFQKVFFPLEKNTFHQVCVP